jgi:hypothetical protein
MLTLSVMFLMFFSLSSCILRDVFFSESEVKLHIEGYQISSRNYADVFRVVEDYQGLHGFDVYCAELNQR